MDKYDLNSLLESNDDTIKVYNEKGEEVLNEAVKDLGQKIFNQVKSWAKKLVSGAKFFVKQIKKSIFIMYNKGREYGVIDTGSKKIAAKWTKARKGYNHQAFFINPKVFKGKRNVAAEGSFIDMMSSELLLERTPEEIQKQTAGELSGMAGTIGDIEEPEDDDLESVTGMAGETGAVNFDELYDILNEVAYSLRYRTSYSQDVPSMLLMGPPGAGKTSVMKQFAKDKGMKLKILEISSLYKEVLGGFPTLEKTLKQGIDPSKLKDQDKDLLRDELYQTTVKIQQTDILPPSEDGGKWLLFLDEFNRDEDKMGAAMNLILTGNIGTTYKLPLKTIVVASGNLGKDIDGVPVAKMDAAVWDRFNRKLRLNYDWLGWQKYAGMENAEFTDEEGNTTEMGPLVQSIKAFVLKKTQEERTDDWTLELSQFDEDADGRLTPRTLSKVDRQVKLAAMQDWEEGDIAGKHDKEWYEERYEKQGFPSPQAYYLHVNQWRDQYLPKIMSDVIGPKGGAVVLDLLNKYSTVKKELTEVTVDRALLNWMGLRQGGKKKISKTVRTNFMSEVPGMLEEIGTVSKLKSRVQELTPDEKALDTVDKDYAMYVAVNIHNFFKDTKTGLEDAASFVDSLVSTESYEKYLSTEPKKKEKMLKSNALVAVLTRLVEASPLFSEAFATVAEAAEEETETEEPEKFQKAMNFAEKGMFADGTEAPEEMRYMSPEDLKNVLFLSNLKMLDSNYMNKKLTRGERGSGRGEFEESLKTVLGKML